MSDSVQNFYEDLASDYHLIFADWKAAVLEQGEVLDSLIRGEMDSWPLAVLDCSCGIGTQAIGLALRGYRVHGTDLSPAAVGRASQEAESFGTSLSFGVADLRALDTQVEGTFDVVISCDNSLPHLLGDDELLLAARNMLAKLKAGGLIVVSTRNYDQIAKKRPRFDTPRVLDGPEGKRLILQVWDWASGTNTYIAHHFIIREVNGEWTVKHNSTKYRAVLRHELSEILRQAGFSEVQWRMPKESRYYQPLVLARKP